MQLLNDLYTIISASPTADGYVFVIEPDPEHFIYKAHFPGEPITPGVCIMQIALELCEEATGTPLSVSCVKNVKFLRIISPDEITSVRYSLQKITWEDDILKVQITVSSGEDIYAKLSLICRKREQ